MTHPEMTCDGLDERLAEYLEGTLAPAPRRAAEAHLAGCARCAALVHELRELSLHAAALPELAPSRDLWSGIAERIEAPVIPLAAAPRAAAPMWRRNAWMGAAAAALVVATAGITYSVTMSRVGSFTYVAAGDTSVAPSPVPERAAPARGDAATQVAAAPDPAADTRTPAASPSRSLTVADAGTRRPAAPAGAREVERSAASRVVVELEQSTVGYDEEITRLRRLLNERRGQLDPRTAAVLETSISSIDNAIAQSRAALQTDPASRFLVEQLNKTLEKKVELLRTAVLLPGRA